MAEIVVVANRKGGTAKTTTVVNLAYALLQSHKRVLVFDLDNQGHVTLGFAESQQALQKMTNPAWLHDMPEIQGVYAYDECLHLALANTAQEADHDSVSLERVTQMLDSASATGLYDVILVDTPPTLGPILLSALAAAHRIIIPAEPTPLASDGVKKLLNACLRAISKKHFRATTIEILPVMVDGQLKLHRQVLVDWTKRFGQGRLLPAIRRNIKLAEAFAAHIPVNRFAPGCAGAQDYRSLCESLFSNQEVIYENHPSS